MLISTAMMVVGTFFVVGALQLYIRGKFAELDVLDKKARRRALDIVGVVSRRQGLDDSSDIDGKGAQGFQTGRRDGRRRFIGAVVRIGTRVEYGGSRVGLLPSITFYGRSHHDGGLGGGADDGFEGWS